MPTPTHKPGKTPRANDLAMIHIAKTQLGLDDETYRAMLWSIARVESSKALDYAGRRKVIEHLRTRGWQSKPSTAARQGAVDRQSQMIFGLWRDLDRVGLLRDASDRALSRFVKRQTGVDQIAWLSTTQSSQVIESLKAWLSRST